MSQCDKDADNPIRLRIRMGLFIFVSLPLLDIGQRQPSSSDSYLITSAQTAAGLLAMMTHGRLEDRLGPSRTRGYPVRPYDFGHECVHVASLVCAWWQVTVS